MQNLQHYLLTHTKNIINRLQTIWLSLLFLNCKLGGVKVLIEIATSFSRISHNSLSTPPSAKFKTTYLQLHLAFVF